MCINLVTRFCSGQIMGVIQEYRWTGQDVGHPLQQEKSWFLLVTSHEYDEHTFELFPTFITRGKLTFQLEVSENELLMFPTHIHRQVGGLGPQGRASQWGLRSRKCWDLQVEAEPPERLQPPVCGWCFRGRQVPVQPVCPWPNLTSLRDPCQVPQLCSAQGIITQRTLLPQKDSLLVRPFLFNNCLPEKVRMIVSNLFTPEWSQ